MKIGINFQDVILRLAPTSENTEYYLCQLARESHDLRIITDDSVDDAKKWLTDRGLPGSVLGAGCESEMVEIREDLDVYFNDRSISWWEIYDEVRYGS